MIDPEVALLLIGAAIALASGLIGALVQHLLSLRADRIKRERDRGEEQRAILSEGALDRAPGLQFAPLLKTDSTSDKRFILHRIYRVFKELLAEREVEGQKEGQDEPAE
jgi:hypothetical protein